jgi:predicted permease
MFDRLRFEISSAWRSLASTPALTVTALVTLAVTIGVNFAMLGFAHRALNGVPDGVTAPARLFTLAFDHDLRDRRVVMSSTSYPTFVALRDRVRAFSGAAAWRRTSTVAVVGTEQVPVDAVQVSGGYFQVLGTPPRLGRGLVPADDDEAAAFPVAAVSDGFWRRVFHADPEVIGRRMVVGSIDYTIVGVMPPGFSGHTIERADIWVPFAAAMRAEPGWQTQTFRNIASIIVRLADGETPASAAGQAAADAGTPVVFRAVAGADMAPAERRVVLWLTGVSVLVFVIGLANSATLLLVRSVRRRYQMAIRIALGASRARLLGSTIVETALLGATAGALSLLFAGWFETLIHRTLLPKLADASGLNARTAAIGIVAGLVASLAAAIVTGSRLPSSGLSAGVSMRTPSAHRPFLVLQTTLSVVLLAGAGLLGRSLWNLASQDFGFRMADVWLVELDQGSRDLTDPDTFYRTALDRVRALPGVEEASIKQSLPFSSHHVPPMHVPGLAEPPMTNGQLPFMVAATPELFRILGVQLVEGRLLTHADDRGAPVVVVSQALARTAWPGVSALGKCIQAGFDPSFDPFAAGGPPPAPTTLPCREVVGVVRDLRQRSVVPAGGEDRLMHYFVPFSQVPGPPAGIPGGPGISGLLVRTRVDGPPALTSAIRQAVVGDRRDVPFVRVTPYIDLRDRQMRPWRVGTTLLALFGALALAVASLGLYAAFTHVVSERRREMAIRLALGAAPRRVVRMILLESARIAGLGVLAGCAAAVAGGRWLGSLLFGTSPADPVVLTAAAAVMLAVGLIATLLPALAASRSDPNSLLRHL